MKSAAHCSQHSVFLSKNVITKEYGKRINERGEDRPHKENDHAMDEMRYFIMEMAGQRPGRGGFWAAAGPERNSF